MKSKTSFFNPKLMGKFIRLYWPIWGCYLVVLLVEGPISLWLSFSQEMRGSGEDFYADAVYSLSYSMNTDLMVIVTAAMSVVTAMALFSYLFNSRSANMMHAFPVTRLELFNTNLVTGLSFILVPQFICFLLDVLICLEYKVLLVENLAYWLLVGIGVAIIMYGMAVFCAMLTGQLFVLPCYFIILQGFYPGLRMLVQYSLGFLGIGLETDGLTRFSESKLNFLAPIYRLCSDVYFERHMTYDGQRDYYICDGMAFHGGWTVFGYALAGIAFCVLAYLIYRKRNVEQAGDLITVSFLKPVFRWGVGVCGGIFGAYIVNTMLQAVVDENSALCFALCLLVFGFLFFAFAQMLLRKNFRIWNKKFWREAGAFACFTLVFFFGMNGVADKASHVVPDVSEVEVAQMNFSYQLSSELDENVMADIVEAHAAILDYLDTHEAKDYDESCVYVTFVYKMKNGSYIRRSYDIPYREDSKELYAMLASIEANDDYYEAYLFDGLQDDPDCFTNGYLTTYDSDYENSKDYTILKSQAPAIARAILADIEAGNLQKYNLITDGDYSTVPGTYAANLYVYGETLTESVNEDYYDSNSGLFTAYDPRESLMEYANVNVNFGEDCVNIIQALIDEGVIESTDELHEVELD